ncbi:AfsR/SARP family transcriptional regulator [Jiangella mangrovi]|uniref:Putative ATPase n=1 Tax=Jiangella mangrovi TaxID=1524084 RepID=A0A7W9GTZ9_9ACTN|nr:BTAD domain-containing putative transcriptional regulator [Jiangella mangrovi]MBB5789666.1 putative ATPase [Jiangella mangrovi]
MDSTVRVGLLGPVRLAVGGDDVAVPGPKRRAVLAVLALAEGRAVTADHLLDVLWPGELPESGRAALHSHVSRLRGHLGAASGRLETLDGGYRLRLVDGELDHVRARALLAQARIATDDPAAAVELLRSALALWRGPALAELAAVEPLATAATGLDLLRRDVTEALAGCLADAGAAGDAASAAEAVVLAGDLLAADPLREPAARLHVRALAAAGQRADALAAGRAFRRRLADEAGMNPSAELGDLERAVAGGSLIGRAPRQRRTRVAEHPVHPGATDGPVLPRPAGVLRGRDAQLAAVERLLATERLVTLVGPGGVGKTRLALEVALRAGAVAVLPLAAVTDPASAPHALAGAIGLNVVHGDVLAACAAVLRTGPGLLVVDGCEQLPGAARDTVATLLGACPDLTVLATGREPLGLDAECTSRLAPLPLPTAFADGDAIRSVPSVAVVLDRAEQAAAGAVGDEELPLVAAIVRAVDGVPLALELAAARLTEFSTAELHARLDGAADVVAWSYDLLGDDERRFLRHLAAFPDGVDLPVAERIGADLGVADPAAALARLAGAALVSAGPERPVRYRLPEPVRAFGRDRLAAGGEEAAADGRLLRWALDTVAWIDAAVLSEDEPAADAFLRRELPNLRAAWALARRTGNVDAAVALVTGLSEVSSRRDVAEPRGWAEELAADPVVETHPARADVVAVTADAAYRRGDRGLAERRARAGLEPAASGSGSPSASRAAWRCLTTLAQAELAQGRFAEAAEHALAAAAIDPWPATAYGTAALARLYDGDRDGARALTGPMADAAGSPTARAFTAYVEAEIANAAGEWEPAEQYYATAIAGFRASGATAGTGLAAVGLLTARADAGRLHDALEGYRDAVEYFARTGAWTQLWVTLRTLADLLRRLGDGGPAAILDAAADRAPDAPLTRPPGSPLADAPPGGVPGRAAVLRLARDAIARNLP